jgi:tetratricopeptide (TPR) repeat protein
VSGPTDAAERLIAEGNRAEDAGKLQEACALYREAARLAPQSAKAHLNLGIALQALGDEAGAVAGYEKALAIDAANPYARYNLGKLRYERGAHAEAEQLLRQALCTRPDFPQARVVLACALDAQGKPEAAATELEAAQPQDFGALFIYAGILRKLGRLDAAASTLRRALAVDPHSLDAHAALFHVLEAKGDPAGAALELEVVLRQRPDWAEVLYSYGCMLRRQLRLEEAEGAFRRALAVEPGHAGAHRMLGEVLLAHCRTLKRYEEALASFDKALAIQPDHADALNNRGLALQELKRYDEALASYDKALAVRSDLAEVLSNRGAALQELRRYDEALASFDKALAIQPDLAEALSNRGIALQELKRYDEALASFGKALAVKPDYADALNNRGNALKELQRHDEALASYNEALAIRPDYAEAHLNQSMCRLLIGDLERGWEQYEWRWASKNFPSPRRKFLQPLWLGKEDIAGRTLLLHAEQGLGDTIQFARYTQAIAQKGARVILEVQPTLRSLMSGISGAHQVLSHGEPLPQFEFHCPLLSLPLAFNTRLPTIPVTTPYLRAAEAAVKTWEDRLGQRNALRVGIVWSGSLANKNDHNRSIALSRLVALASLGARLVSLQNEVRAEDEKALAANKHITHFGSELKDFSDTAALVSLMDLVISVDTSVAHLAGALGKPVWILLPFAPDWRWLLDREDSPWYPTARLFRQPMIGDWDSVIHTVIDSLSKCVGSNPAAIVAMRRRS